MVWCGACGPMSGGLRCGRARNGCAPRWIRTHGRLCTREHAGPRMFWWTGKAHRGCVAFGAGWRRQCYAWDVVLATFGTWSCVTAGAALVDRASTGVVELSEVRAELPGYRRSGYRSGTQRFRGASRRSTQPLAPRQRALRGPPPHRGGCPRDPREPPGQAVSHIGSAHRFR